MWTHFASNSNTIGSPLFIYTSAVFLFQSDAIQCLFTHTTISSHVLLCTVSAFFWRSKRSSISSLSCNSSRLKWDICDKKFFHSIEFVQASLKKFKYSCWIGGSTFVISKSTWTNSHRSTHNEGFFFFIDVTIDCRACFCFCASSALLCTISDSSSSYGLYFARRDANHGNWYAFSSDCTTWSLLSTAFFSFVTP